MRGENISFLELIGGRARELEDLAEQANVLDSYYGALRRRLEGLGGEVYRAVVECEDLSAKGLYGEAVRLAVVEAGRLSEASERLEEVLWGALEAYAERLHPLIRQLGVWDTGYTVIGHEHALLLAKILHAAYLVTGIAAVRYASQLMYAASLTQGLTQREFMELLLLAPASYRAYARGDWEWSLAMLSWPLRRLLPFKPPAEPPLESPKPHYSTFKASYLREVAIPVDQEVLYKWGVHKALQDLQPFY